MNESATHSREHTEKSESSLMAKAEEIFAQSNNVLSKQIAEFTLTAAPYMVNAADVSALLHDDPEGLLGTMSFFRLRSCTVEDMKEAAEYLNSRMSKLFTAMHSLMTPVMYGVISRKGQTNIVIGIDARSADTVEAILNGLLTGIEIEKMPEPIFPYDANEEICGGFVSGVPILKIGEEKQQIDLSTLIKSLNGNEYTFMVYCKPITDAQERYRTLLSVKDSCVAISKRSLSLQNSINSNRTTTNTSSTNRRGILQELISQIARDKKINVNGLLDALMDSGINNTSVSVSTSETLEGISDGVSFDVQNGIALEMLEYCDKAIERLKTSIAAGLWEVSISYSATAARDLGIMKSSILSELAKPSTDIMPLAHFNYPNQNNHVLCLPAPSRGSNPLLTPITSLELGLLCTPPSSPVPDFEVKLGKYYPMIPASGNVTIGQVSDGQRPLPNMPFGFSTEDLNKHTFVCGITGSGKTNTTKHILHEAGVPYLVIESAKKEYRNIPDIDAVYTLGKPEINCIQMNPFYVQYGISLQTHIDYLKDLFNAAFSFYGPMPYILEKCLSNIYRARGWNLTLGYHPYIINLSSTVKTFDASYMREQYALRSCNYIFPTMQDLKNEVERYIDKEMKYDGEVAGNIKSAIISRLNSLCVGSKGFMFNTNFHLDMDELMQKRTVFELEGLSDDSDKAFCVGLLVVFINEYRQIEKAQSAKNGLRHLLVIEEAHRLLKNVETERASESMGNPKGKAVEHFTNMIAEMRSYGQGVIIAEQIPSKLAPDVIKNSSNKIVQRIVSADDQALIANTIGIKVDDAVFLGSLRTGFGLCHKEGMNLPVLVKIAEHKDIELDDDTILKMSGKNMATTFEAINKQLLTESIGEDLDKYAYRILDTIMVSSESVGATAVRWFRETMDYEVRKHDISLLPSVEPNRESLYGLILSERIIALINCGVYGFGHLAPNELFNELDALCVKGLSELVSPVKERLTSLYKRKTEAQCISIVAKNLKSDCNTSTDLKSSISRYFITVSDDIIEKIKERIGSA